MSLHVASWNVNSLRVRLPQLVTWLAGGAIDVVGLQETKLTDDAFPHTELEQLGYQAVASGQKTYNGVALLARTPLTEVVTDFTDLDDPQRRLLAATVDGIRYVNVYVPNGQAVGADKYQYKLRWLRSLRRFLQHELQSHEQLVVMGDFNIAPEDRDVHDPVLWKDQILCSEPEREAFQGLLGLGLADTFRLFDQPSGSFSWWDYRQGGFRRNLGLRIDLVLASGSLAARCLASEIDTEPRRADRPSDHAPVTAGFGPGQAAPLC
jgi:exodeoxyribonuclease III